MIPILYIRSSFLSGFDYCQHSFFLTNVLGHSSLVNHRAELGTTVHKSLECIALCQKEIQQGKSRVVIKDEETGINIDVIAEDFIKPSLLDNQEIDKINYSRRNKENFLPCHRLSYGHIRYGRDFVDNLIHKVYDYYASKSKNEWTAMDRKTVWNWTWMALENGNRLYDPRNHRIFAAETHFSFPLEKDWATYEYDGKKGYIELKGTIDLILEHPDNVIEICDYKTGRQISWNTMKDKDYNVLQHDKQLIMYYYCARKLWPDKTILLTINYIRFDGPITVCYDDDKLEEAETIFKQFLKETKQCKTPSLLDPEQKDFRCFRICEYYKRTTKEGPNMCRFIAREIQEKGIDKVTELYTRKDFELGHYKDPGSV